MAVYKCRICGAIYDEEKEGKPVSELDCCPVCRLPVSNLERVDDPAEAPAPKAYVGALEDPKVLILGHTGRAGVPFELDAVLTAARDLGKLIEINEHSLADKPESIEKCRQIAERCAELGVHISVSSDAHASFGVGGFDNALAMLEQIHFPQELIATRTAATFERAIRDARIPAAV